MLPYKIISLDKPPGTWLLGGGWNNDLWGGDMPMASWVDDITPHNPVSVVNILNAPCILI